MKTKPDLKPGFTRLFALMLGKATWTKRDHAALAPVIHRYYGKKPTKPAVKKCRRR